MRFVEYFLFGQDKHNWKDIAAMLQSIVIYSEERWSKYLLLTMTSLKLAADLCLHICHTCHTCASLFVSITLSHAWLHRSGLIDQNENTPSHNTHTHTHTHSLYISPWTSCQSLQLDNHGRIQVHELAKSHQQRFHVNDLGCHCVEHWNNKNM